jgi:hypothetical protein
MRPSKNQREGSKIFERHDKLFQKEKIQNFEQMKHFLFELRLHIRKLSTYKEAFYGENLS